MLDTISTVKMSREEWLEERRKSIGGSDAAAVIGMSRFASPYTVWMDKTGASSGKGRHRGYADRQRSRGVCCKAF